MKRALKKITDTTVEQLRNDRSLAPEITGIISDLLKGEVYDLSGDVTLLRGDVTGLRGNVSNLLGDVSGLYGKATIGLIGEMTGLKGDVTGLRGDVMYCNLTDDERKKGVFITDLVS
jgi:hypothetical protein